MINDFKPDYVVNFAAQGMVEQSWLNPEDWFKTNTLANVKLHDQLRKFNSLKKYLNTLSFSESHYQAVNERYKNLFFRRFLR